MKSLYFQSLFLFLICLGALAGYWAWYSLVEAKSVAVATLDQKIMLNTSIEGRIESARASLAEIAKDEENIRSYFISDNDVAAFNDALESKRHTPDGTVRVTSVSKTGSGVQSALAFVLAIDGTFDAVMRTVGMIEYAPFAVTVSGLSLHLDKAQSTPLWHADMTILVSSVAATVATTTDMTTATSTAP